MYQMNMGMKYRPRLAITAQNTQMKAMKPHTSFSFIPTTDRAGMTYRGWSRLVHSSPYTKALRQLARLAPSMAFTDSTIRGP